MSTYRMEDGTVVKTENATNSWEEDTDWDGNNHIGRSSCSQWNHQELHRSKKGRYYIEHTSNYQGSMPHAEWVSPQEATRWLIHNDEDLPDDLKEYEETVCE